MAHGGKIWRGTVRAWWMAIIVSTCATAHAAGEAWVVVRDGRALVRVDNTGEVVTAVDLPGVGFAVAARSDGGAWVGIESPAQVVAVSADGAHLRSVTTVAPVRALAIAADDSVWAVVTSLSLVLHLDAEGQELGSFATGLLPTGVCIAGDGRVWVTNAYGNSVTRFEPNGSGAEEFAAGFYPTGIAAHPDERIWVVCKEHIAILSARGDVVATPVAGVFPRGITVARNGDVWVTNQVSSSVTRFAANGDVRAELPVGALPWGVAAAGDGSVIVLSRLADSVQRFASDGVLLGTMNCEHPHACGDLTGLARAMIVAPAADADGDGAPNFHEALVGADPLTAASFPATFVRGDADGNRGLELADVVRLLTHLSGDVTSLPCPEAADIDDDGALTIGDAVSLLAYLYVGGSAPAAPYPSAGYDPDPLDASSCGV